jgi:ribosomal protein L34
MKMSASEYYCLPTIRKMRRLIRNQVRKSRLGISSPVRKKVVGIRVRIICRDASEGNILKTRRYKGRIKRG